jgi:hypothetical protein
MRRHQSVGSIIAIVAAFLIGGCAQLKSGVNAINTIMLQVGMTRDEVVATMGKPQIREAYGRTEILIYRTDLLIGPQTVDFTPVVLVNGKVTGWGREIYDETRRKRASANAGGQQQKSGASVGGQKQQ